MPKQDLWDVISLLWQSHLFLPKKLINKTLKKAVDFPQSVRAQAQCFKQIPSRTQLKQTMRNKPWVSLISKLDNQRAPQSVVAHTIDKVPSPKSTEQTFKRAKNPSYSQANKAVNQRKAKKTKSKKSFLAVRRQVKSVTFSKSCIAVSSRGRRYHSGRTRSSKRRRWSRCRINSSNKGFSLRGLSLIWGGILRWGAWNRMLQCRSHLRCEQAIGDIFNCLQLR